MKWRGTFVITIFKLSFTVDTGKPWAVVLKTTIDRRVVLSQQSLDNNFRQQYLDKHGQYNWFQPAHELNLDYTYILCRFGHSFIHLSNLGGGKIAFNLCPYDLLIKNVFIATMVFTLLVILERCVSIRKRNLEHYLWRDGISSGSATMLLATCCLFTFFYSLHFRSKYPGLHH